MAIAPSNPKISPSLNQLGPALLTDENGSQLPCVAVVDVDSSGHTGLADDLITDKGHISQVTGLQDPPQAAADAVPKVPVLALCGINKSTGALEPFKPAKAALADSATSAVALAGKFVSTELTGTGSAQNVAHGLVTVPSAVLISITDPGLETAGAADGAKRAVIVEGTHTTTNVVVTVTSGAKFKVLALK